MDFHAAAEWVRNNEPVIKNKIAKYRNFSPYEESDYLQEAFEAAMVAVVKSREKAISFEAAFWMTFRNQISVLTPSSGSHGSNSVPSHLCTVDLDTINVRHKGGRSRKPNIEAIYNSVSHFLTKKEQEMIYLSLGISHEGKLSNYEIAERVGCSVKNVRETLDRGFGRIKRLISEGKIDASRLR